MRGERTNTQASRKPTDSQTEGAVVPKWPFREIFASKTKQKHSWNRASAVRSHIHSYSKFVRLQVRARASTQIIYRRVCLRLTFLFLVYFLSDFWLMQLQAEMSAFTFAWAKSTVNTHTDWWRRQQQHASRHSVNQTHYIHLCICCCWVDMTSADVVVFGSRARALFRSLSSIIHRLYAPMNAIMLQPALNEPSVDIIE